MMTENDVRKALERCPQHIECCYCNSLEECGNKRILTTSALDLINRQKEDIERLEKELELANADKVIAATHEKFAKEMFVDVTQQIKTAKSEAIKEFWNKVKEQSYVPQLSLTGTHVIDVIDGDNIAKEMTEAETKQRKEDEGK